MTQKINLEGETIRFNPEEKRVNLVISEPFLKANTVLNWGLKLSPGLGINKSIAKFVIKTESYLCVYVDSWNQTYFIKWDRLKQFIKNYNTEYRVGTGTKYIHIISCEWFTNTRGN